MISLGHRKRLVSPFGCIFKRLLSPFRCTDVYSLTSPFGSVFVFVQ